MKTRQCYRFADSTYYEKTRSFGRQELDIFLMAGIFTLHTRRNIDRANGPPRMVNRCTLQQPFATKQLDLATLFWNNDVKDLVDIYLTYHYDLPTASLLPACPPCWYHSMILYEDHRVIPATPAILINVTGSVLKSSQVPRRLQVSGKRLNPGMKGNLKGSRIRKDTSLLV